MHETRIVGEGRQEAAESAAAVSVLYNDEAPLSLNFSDTVSVLADIGTGASGEGDAGNWEAVGEVSGPAADGSNQLRLYDADWPLLPSGLSLKNITVGSSVASNGDWRARIDAEGGVWMWVVGSASAEAVEPEAIETQAVGSDNEGRDNDQGAAGGSGEVKVTGLPPIGTLALGGGHAVALTEEGEVWTWEMESGAPTS
ncbi:MAG: hypothetical protein LBK99_06140, partial [Opitutaceae bacterium]|nr:hypothetical protein [Opitutaceae bacterium]